MHCFPHLRSLTWSVISPPPSSWTHPLLNGILGIHGNTPRYSTRQVALSIRDLELPGLEGNLQTEAQQSLTSTSPVSLPRLCSDDSRRVKDSSGLHDRWSLRLSSAVSTLCGEVKGYTTWRLVKGKTVSGLSVKTTCNAGDETLNGFVPTAQEMNTLSGTKKPMLLYCTAPP